MPGATIPPFQVCFVCSGNICRSPMAESVFRALIERGGYEGRITAESAGTGDWHVGERADIRARATLTAHGYDADEHRARQFDPDWFDDLDLVVAFDHGQERRLLQAAPTDPDRAKVVLLRAFDPSADEGAEVPDPYYSDDGMFTHVLGMIERACAGLYRQMEPGIRAAG